MQEGQSSTEPRNVCAGPFGVAYDYYIDVAATGLNSPRPAP